MNSFYEIHHHPDPQFPFICHVDHLPAGKVFNAHWHESIEMLYCLSGSGDVTSDRLSKLFQPGDLAVINSNHIHRIYTGQPNMRYICLIIDKSFTDQMGLDVEKLQYRMIIRHPAIEGLIQKISQELSERQLCFQAAVKAAVIDLLVILSRQFVDDDQPVVNRFDNPQIQMIKSAINLIRTEFNQPLRIEVICQAVGLSKHYFCRIFKIHTGKTVINYINFLRCCNARSLIMSGQYNIGECARMSGILNLSYFARTYKKHMGILPSEESHPMQKSQGSQYSTAALSIASPWV
jgi:AraC-like DNA-binding protein